MPSNSFSRRSYLTGSLATAFLALVTSPALALTEGAAKALVDKVVAEINRVIASGKSEGAMINDFKKLFNTYADVPIMARYALGADARSASSSSPALRAFHTVAMHQTNPARPRSDTNAPIQTRTSIQSILQPGARWRASGRLSESCQNCKRGRGDVLALQGACGGVSQ